MRVGIDCIFTYLLSYVIMQLIPTNPVIILKFPDFFLRGIRNKKKLGKIKIFLVKGNKLQGGAYTVQCLSPKIFYLILVYTSVNRLSIRLHRFYRSRKTADYIKAFLYNYVGLDSLESNINIKQEV